MRRWRRRPPMACGSNRPPPSSQGHTATHPGSATRRGDAYQSPSPFGRRAGDGPAGISVERWCVAAALAPRWRFGSRPCGGDGPARSDDDGAGLAWHGAVARARSPAARDACASQVSGTGLAAVATTRARRAAMTIATCRSTVVLCPPTPLGLLPARRRVEHTCSLCRQPVPTDRLVEHATGHGPRPGHRAADVWHNSMRAPRRDHYLPPITGDDTETVFEAAIESLATLRGLIWAGKPPPGCISLPASKLRPDAAFPEPSATPVTSSARGPTSPTCSASPARAPSSATAPAPPPTASPSVRHEHPPNLDALPPAHGLVEDLAARCCL